MWILPKQLHTSAYVLDMKELGLDSEAFSQTCERSLTWRGKDSLSRTWLQRWKRESWMQHLSSRTLRPSHTESFVDAWTSSLEDSRVSHSQLLESVKLLKTPDTCSPTSQTESESANLELFSLKTYKESSVARQPTENQFSNMSSESWKDWVIEQRQEYSQRKKSAHLIRESESSSWPTTTTRDWKDTMNTVPPCIGKTRGLTLGNAVAKELQKNWPPQPCKPSERSEKANKGGCKNLREELANSNSKRLEGVRQCNHSQGREASNRQPRGGDQVWPSRPSEPQHEWEEPRVTGQAEPQLGRTPNGSSSRVDRLRLLGNGVVPQTAAKAFTTLSQRLI
jgi:hypothetical protein